MTGDRTRRRSSNGLAVSALLALGLAACATAPAAPRASPLASATPVSVDSRRLAAEGLDELSRQDYDRALRLFNAAIKFDSDNPTYHLFAGATYHLRFLAGGGPDLRDEAEIGYQLAGRYAPLDPLPWLQLGRLYLEAHQEARAKDAFAKAVALRPDDLDAWRGLAAASYVTGDLVMALWCADELERRHAEAPEIARYRVVFYSALGDRARAGRYREAYLADGRVPAAARASLGDSLSRIDGLIESRTWLARPGAAAGLVRLAAEDAAAHPTAPLQAAPGPQRGPTPAPAGPGDARVAWWTCQGAAPVPPPAGAPPPASQLGADETQPLPALPPPCAGAPPPRVAQIDVVLVSTNDEMDRSYGLNLLQGLTGYFGYLANATKVGAGPTEKVRSLQLALGGSAGPSAPLSYSLNIANSAVSHDDIIARPTLMAIDRTPSTFFSGESVAIAVGGGAGSVSSLNDRQVGISVSITPTFLDDARVLLSVRVAQSGVETPWTQATGVNLQQSRNMASASLVATYGQTVILSGLTQRERSRTDSGVPVLKRVPGLQYLFATSTPVDTYKTTMMLLTVRRPDEATGAGAPAGGPLGGGYPFDWRVRDYERRAAAEVPDLETALARASSEEMYRGLRLSDLGMKPWAGDSFTQSLRELLAH